MNRDRGWGGREREIEGGTEGGIGGGREGESRILGFSALVPSVPLLAAAQSNMPLC